MFSSKPAMTRGQAFEKERQRRLTNRAEAMKNVASYVVQDVHTQIDIESKADPTKTIFTIYLPDILANPALYSKSYFDKACGSTKTTPYITELAMFVCSKVPDVIVSRNDVRFSFNEKLCTCVFDIP